MTTRGGANSGKTSTCIFGSEVMPRTIRPTAAATTRYRNFRLELMIAPHQGPARRLGRLGSVHSSPLMLYSVPSSSAAPTVTTGVPAAGPADSSATSPSMSVTVIGSRS